MPCTFANSPRVAATTTAEDARAARRWALQWAAPIALLAAGCHNFVDSFEPSTAPAFDDALLEAGAAAPEDWPGWRGGMAHGVALAESLPTEWGPHRNVRWRVDLPGAGNSSPVVSGEHVFLTSVVGEGHRAQLTLLALDRRSGELRWQAELGAPVGPTHQKNGHASATVATDGRRVIAFFGAKGLYCYSVDGERLWRQPLVELKHDWGFASSPVLAGHLVVQLCDSQTESFIAAFDKRTGEQVWRTARGSNGCWSTPVVVRPPAGAAGPWQVIVNGAGSNNGSQGFVTSYDLSSGTQLWQLPGTADIVCPTLIVGPQLAVSTSGGNGPILAFDPTSASQSGAATTAWSAPHGGPNVSTGVIYRERLYLAGDEGVLTCRRAATGEEVWRHRIGAPVNASLVAGAGCVYVTTETGEIVVIAADDEPHVLATNRLGEPCLATPAVAGDALLVRTESRLYCIGEPTTDSESPPAESAPAAALDDTVRSPSDVSIAPPTSG
ncbi:MAG: PQQ-binding-like beta-propeller repeat protein [Planctomycetales bacterium]|nr:PQQ-binding-like beta-propeller repeat protein [Planctomycetales bacterium]